MGDDVAAIVAMLANDPLGATRESPGDLTPYLAAFAVIDADPHLENSLVSPAFMVTVRRSS